MAHETHMKRPFDGMTDPEIQAWQAKEYQELLQVHDDGMEFVGKTASIIAYERMLESEKPEHVRLFNDHLAKYFAEPYGKKGSECLASGLIIFFDPNKDNGLLFDGHVAYTAARTKLINDYMGEWIDANEHSKQVLDLGAGFSTRPFYVESLKNVTVYTEVDTKPVNDAKEKVLNSLRCKGELNDPFCTRMVISMDFQKQSVSDLPTMGFDQSLPTCWILEGLVMYLKPEETKQLLQKISKLSTKGSYIILNFYTMSPAANPDDMDTILEAEGWTKTERVFFGDEHFNYGRYPEGKPANTVFGFSFYAMV